MLPGTVVPMRANLSSRSGARCALGGVATAVVAALILAGCSDDGSGNETTPAVAESPASSTASSSVAGTETTAATPTTTSTATQGSLPVYWVRTTARSTFLYREFQSAEEGSGDTLTDAVRQMMTGTPIDPDYTTHWSEPSSLSVTRSGEDITVDVSADAVAKTGVTPAQAESSVQQLVWTATAAAQSSGRVTLLLDGEPGTAWGVDVGTPMARTATARAPIWIDNPTHGSTVTTTEGKVRITGSANVFEGNVIIEIADPAGKEVARAMGTAAMGTYEPFETSVELAPGSYVLTAYEPDESGGESAEGPKMFPVTTAFTVTE